MHRCTISHIDPDSPLRHAAHPGDRLVSINGNPITDVLDYKYYAYDPELAVCLRRPDGTEHTVHVSKPLGGELGLDFETYLMDNAHSCANHCVFCFIDQMPPGMRPTLYFKDDDARLSFLMGNYMKKRARASIIRLFMKKPMPKNRLSTCCRQARCRRREWCAAPTWSVLRSTAKNRIFW